MNFQKEINTQWNMKEIYRTKESVKCKLIYKESGTMKLIDKKVW